MANLSPVDFCGILVVVLAVLGTICPQIEGICGLIAIGVALLLIFFLFIEKDTEQ
jgi:hypothetical protein